MSTDTMVNVKSMEDEKKNSDSEVLYKKKVHKRKKKTTKDYVIEFVVKIVLTVAAVWILCTCVIGVYVNHSNSSYPMIKDGDLCITYRLGDLREGEEIAYEYEGKIRFGRIVAMSGDVVEIKDDVITVNGYNVLEDVVYPTTSEGSQIIYPYTVSENTVFVLNDYRDDVSDSRSFGAIPLKDTRGKVVFIMRRRGI